jgi:hypothetical protein
VSSILGGGLQGLVEELVYLCISEAAGTARFGLIVQAHQTLREETATPLADTVIGEVQVLGNGGVIQAVIRQEDNPGEQSQSPGPGAGPAHALQFLAQFFAQPE